MAALRLLEATAMRQRHLLCCENMPSAVLPAAAPHQWLPLGNTCCHPMRLLASQRSTSRQEQLLTRQNKMQSWFGSCLRGTAQQSAHL